MHPPGRTLYSADMPPRIQLPAHPPTSSGVGNRTGRIVLALVALVGLGGLLPEALAVPVRVRAVEASTEERDYPLSAAVDGIIGPANGWGMLQGAAGEHYGAFATDKPLNAAMCQFQFLFHSGISKAHFGDFEIDVTTDVQPTVRGRWMPLIPDQALADCAEGALVLGPVIRLRSDGPVNEVTVWARAPFHGITGFRLKLFNVERDGRPTVGCSTAGGFVLTEMRIETEPQRGSNIALGRQIYCSRGVPSELPMRNLTDGFYSTFSHPDPGYGGATAFFELDLGRMVLLDHITIRGRDRGADADRLATYKVELLTESGGFPGQVQWQSRLRLASAPLPLGGAEVLRVTDGLGVFHARRILLHNQSGELPQPQFAELEVYPALLPRVRDWLADGRAVSSGAEVGIPAGTRRVEFTIGCGAFEELADAITYRWRLSGWDDAWQETGADGRVTLAPAPPAGQFRLEVQARHSDGLWDESGLPVSLRVSVPWWRNSGMVPLAVGGTLVLLAASWWRLKAAGMTRRLAHAEAHLDLHRERLRIARDMHDDIGARLTYIALLADRAQGDAERRSEAEPQLLAALAENARASVTALDAIVWAVNPQHDSVGDLADYLADYAPAYLSPAGIQCRLELQVTAPGRPLGLTLRHSLLLAIKEALQNVVRHAGATHVHVALHDAGGRLRVEVTDDGRGLGEAARGVSHSGLGNMRQRLAEVGGSCDLGAGERGRGTRVTFLIPLKSSPPT
jgi:signal transduction histidine kinase